MTNLPSLIAECKKDLENLKRYRLAESISPETIETLVKALEEMTEVLKEIAMSPYKDSDVKSLLQTLQMRAGAVLEKWEVGNDD